MAEKIKATLEMIDKHEFKLEFDDHVPYVTIEDMGKEIGISSMIMDETGCAYESWRGALVEFFVIMKGCSNLDTDNWTSYEDQAALYDRFAPAVKEYREKNREAFELMDRIVLITKAAIKTSYENQNSVLRKIGILLSPILNGEPFTDILNDAKKTSEDLITLLGKVEDAANPSTVPLTLFAKKDS